MGQAAPPLAAAAAAAAAIAGGVLHATKGAVLFSGGPDLGFVPAMTLLFAGGLLLFAVSLRHSQSKSRLGAIVMLAIATIGAAVATVYKLFGTAPEQAGSPTAVRVAYVAATLGILAGLLSLAVACWQGHVGPRAWRLVLLGCAVAWMPLEALTAVAPDGVGLLLAGCTWVLAGVALIHVAFVHDDRARRLSPARR